jgi:enoyl-CoA hydratase
MSERPPVRYERSGSASVLILDRPEKRNPVDGETARLLGEGVARFERDDAARVLVLTGAGPAFCAGADLKALETLDIDAPWGPLGCSRLTPSKPTIAAVSGWCLAGGVELALWCDIRIAAEGTTFGLFERRFGVPLCDGGTQRLPRVVGLGRALELILTGRPVDAEEAHRIGLVQEVVEDDEVDACARDLAQRIARNAPIALQLTKHLVRMAESTPLGVGLAYENDLFSYCFTTRDSAEGIAAFREKRQPRFTGE